MSSPLLEARDVTTGYGRQPVLEGVSLAIHHRDYLAVIGPNGGGKTTLLKVLLGLLPPWSGEVIRRTTGRPGALGYVPQFATFEPDFPVSVRDVVLMGRLGLRGPAGPYRARDRDVVAATMERFGLAPLSRHPVSDLSGGQLQRVLIARALAAEPEVLFLDEPLASIDAAFRQTLLETLAELRETIPVVVVTHDLTPYAAAVAQIACVNRRLHYHPEGRLTPALLEEVYGCPVELVAHGVPHRVLDAHDPGDRPRPHSPRSGPHPTE